EEKTEIKQPEEIIKAEKTEFFIEKETATIAESDFLPTTDWKKYQNKTYGFEVKYPKEWFVLENAYGGVAFSSSSSGNAYDFNENGKTVAYKNWARVTFTFEPKLKTQTLENWLKEKADPGGPGIDFAVQYIQLGDKKFLGTNQFIQNSQNNAYFEISKEKVLVIKFAQKSDVNQSDIFYTMIKTLIFVTDY
ncbi:MAG: hypothetical protein AAB851_00800, partial [Patescibacteria group bacterium]